MNVCGIGCVYVKRLGACMLPKLGRLSVFLDIAATDRLDPVIVSGVLKLDIKHALPGALGSACI